MGCVGDSDEQSISLSSEQTAEHQLDSSIVAPSEIAEVYSFTRLAEDHESVENLPYFKVNQTIGVVPPFNEQEPNAVSDVMTALQVFIRLSDIVNVAYFLLEVR